MCRLAFLALCLLGGAAFLAPETAAQSTEVALAQLESRAEALGLTARDVSGVEVTASYTSEHNGITHVFVRQQHGGLPVFNAVGGIHLTRSGEVLKLDADFVPGIAGKAPAPSPALDAPGAIRSAADVLGIQGAVPDEIAASLKQRGAVRFAAGEISRDPIPVRLGYWHRDDGTVALAWQLVVHERTVDSDWWEMTVDAASGAVLKQYNYQVGHNWASLYRPAPASQAFARHWQHAQDSAPSTIAHAQATGTYRVYPLPTESPNHGERILVGSDASDDLASPFGWHDTNAAVGAEYTITRGNNAHAYEDRADANTPGYSPDGGASLTFDFTLDPERSPIISQDAVITNMFYWTNVIHDVLYHYGFTESAGNFQQNNYGRGASLGAGDAVRAEAQDGSGTNNANFATPPDGSQPRMQMYLWNPPSLVRLIVHSPESVARNEVIAGASFGPSWPSDGLTADLATTKDGVGTDSDGCEPLTNAAAVSGRIALIDRGNCDFTVKVRNAENAGAIGVLIANNTNDPIFALGGSDGSLSIPAGMVTRQTGLSLKTQINLFAQTVNVTVADELAGAPDADSALDNGIIAHEYGHGVHTRLTGGPSNSSCFGGDEQAGEGWADFFALAFTQLPGRTGAQQRGIGTYAAGDAVDGLGIRAQPYSTDMNINDFTYDTIKDARVSDDGVVPHDVGQVWAMMVWEMYWELVERHGFDPDLYGGSGGNNIAMQLVMDGLKIQRCNPGFVDARDAIISADKVLSGGADECYIWKAFAKRGLGENATQGSSASHTDGTQDFTLPQRCASVVANEGSEGAATFALEANFPNPFARTTEIRFGLETTGAARLAIYDLMGREVATLVDGVLPAGAHTAHFEADGLAAGVYLYRLTAGERTTARRLVVMR